MTHKCEMKTPFASVLHASKFRFEIGYHGIWTWYTIFSTKNEEEKDSIRLMRIGRVRVSPSGTPASSWQHSHGYPRWRQARKSGPYCAVTGCSSFFGGERPPRPHDARKGRHYYTTASQAEACTYSSDAPCGRHGGGTVQKVDGHPPIHIFLRYYATMHTSSHHRCL